MDLTKAALPDSVIVSGKVFKIHTGHPYWFRFAEIIADKKALLGELDFIYSGEAPEDRRAGFDALFGFYYEPKELPRSDGGSSERVLDYAIDSDLVYAGILQCYGIDLFDKPIHWHKVRAMITGLTGTKLNTVLEYRCSTPGKNKELARMKRIWRLPDVMKEETKEAIEDSASVFYAAQFK